MDAIGGLAQGGLTIRADGGFPTASFEWYRQVIEANGIR